MTHLADSPISRRAKSIPTFLNKLYALLQDHQNANCVRWAHNGTGFLITDLPTFTQTVLPKYFKHGNYSSFVRQLNMYDFHKLRQGYHQSYFHHQYFLRNDRNSLANIHRKSEKKSRNRKGKMGDGSFRGKMMEQDIQLTSRVRTESAIKVESENTLVVRSEKKVCLERSRNELENRESVWSHESLGTMLNDRGGAKGEEPQRIATCEMITASKNNILPISFDNIQTSMLSIFY